MKKLFSVFVLVMSTFSLSGCFFSFDERFDWQDVVSGQTFYYETLYTGGGPSFWVKFYIDFSYSGESYDTGQVGGFDYDYYSLRDEEEDRDSYLVLFRVPGSYKEDIFRIYEDGRVYFSDLDIVWEPRSAQEKTELLSKDNMILLTPQKSQ